MIWASLVDRLILLDYVDVPAAVPTVLGELRARGPFRVVTTAMTAGLTSSSLPVTHAHTHFFLCLVIYAHLNYSCCTHFIYSLFFFILLILFSWSNVVVIMVENGKIDQH